jgi:osmotically-inducible protein OsmY
MGVHITDAGVVSRTSPDFELAPAIQAALRRQGDGRLRAVRVAAQAGHVFLAGEVPTYYAKQLAQHAAMSVPGVDRVHNELVVERRRERS